MLPVRLFGLAVCALTLVACSGAGPVVPTPDPVPTGPLHPEYETFDASGYNAQPVLDVQIVHDVPARLMAGRVDVPGRTPAPAPTPQPQEVDGFRIQVFESVDGNAARRIRDQAIAWWESAQNQPGAPSRLEVVLPYLQPHYKVRMGAFETQDEADRALPFIQRQYRGAFVVPDRVTIFR